MNNRRVLDKDELVEAVEEVFSSGVKLQKFLALDQSVAESYRTDLISTGDYIVQILSPSLDNDPERKVNTYWGIQVRKLNSFKVKA